MRRLILALSLALFALPAHAQSVPLPAQRAALPTFAVEGLAVPMPTDGTWSTLIRSTRHPGGYAVGGTWKGEGDFVTNLLLVRHGPRSTPTFSTAIEQICRSETLLPYMMARANNLPAQGDGDCVAILSMPVPVLRNFIQANLALYGDYMETRPEIPVNPVVFLSVNIIRNEVIATTHLFAPRTRDDVRNWRTALYPQALDYHGQVRDALRRARNGVPATTAPAQQRPVVSPSVRLPPRPATEQPPRP
jgi:hypothetical protein